MEHEDPASETEQVTTRSKKENHHAYLYFSFHSYQVCVYLGALNTPGPECTVLANRTIPDSLEEIFCALSKLLLHAQDSKDV